MTSWYAVRMPGKEPVVTESWGDALNAGFSQCQGFGNAAKFSTKEEAERFLKQRAFPHGKAGEIQSWIQRQHFVIRITCFGVMSSTVLCIGYHTMIKMGEYMKCDYSLSSASGPVCIGIREVQLFQQKKMGELATFFFAEIIVAMLCFCSYMCGFMG